MMMVSRTDEEGPWFDGAVDEAGPWVSIVLHGDFDLQAWKEAMAAIPNFDGMRPELNSLIDARDARFVFTNLEVRELIPHVARYLEWRGGANFRSAYVVTRNVDFGISRMIQGLTEELPVEGAVFHSMDAAKVWLREGPKADS